MDGDTKFINLGMPANNWKQQLLQVLQPDRSIPCLNVLDTVLIFRVEFYSCTSVTVTCSLSPRPFSWEEKGKRNERIICFLEHQIAMCLSTDA